MQTGGVGGGVRGCGEVGSAVGSGVADRWGRRWGPGLRRGGVGGGVCCADRWLRRRGLLCRQVAPAEGAVVQTGGSADRWLRWACCADRWLRRWGVLCRQACLAGAWRLRSLTRPRRHCDGKAGCSACLAWLLESHRSDDLRRRSAPEPLCGASFRQRPLTSWSRTVAWPPGGGTGGFGGRLVWPPGGGRGGFGGGRLCVQTGGSGGGGGVLQTGLFSRSLAAPVTDETPSSLRWQSRLSLAWRGFWNPIAATTYAGAPHRSLCAGLLSANGRSPRGRGRLVAAGRRERWLRRSGCVAARRRERWLRRTLRGRRAAGEVASADAGVAAPAASRTRWPPTVRQAPPPTANVRRSHLSRRPAATPTSAEATSPAARRPHQRPPKPPLPPPGGHATVRDHEVSGRWRKEAPQKGSGAERRRRSSLRWDSRSHAKQADSPLCYRSDDGVSSVTGAARLRRNQPVCTTPTPAEATCPPPRPHPSAEATCPPPAATPPPKPPLPPPGGHATLRDVGSHADGTPVSQEDAPLGSVPRVTEVRFAQFFDFCPARGLRPAVGFWRLR